MAPQRGGAPAGFDIGLLFSHKLILATFALAFVGWFVAFIGQIVAEIGVGRQGSLWFAIFLEFFLIAGMTISVITDSLAMARLQLVAFDAVALVYAVSGVDHGIYADHTSLHAIAAGYFLMTISNLIWLLYLTSEDDSPVFALLNSTNQGLGSPGGRGGSRYGGSAPGMRVGGAMGNGSAFAGGFQGGAGSGGYQPAYGHSPSAADITTANGTGLGTSKPTQTPSMRSRQAGDTVLGGAGAASAVGGANSDLGGSASVASHGNLAPGSPSVGSRRDGEGGQPDYGYRARALYAYQANADDPTEISFSKGEVLDIVDNSGKWWQAKKSNGETGIVPSNYMQLL
ncbi:Transmembrane osmosensor [Thecaphora frezii]